MAVRERLKGWRTHTDMAVASAMLWAQVQFCWVRVGQLHQVDLQATSLIVSTGSKPWQTETHSDRETNAQVTLTSRLKH